MEIKSLNTKKPAEEGAFLHLRDPFEGHLLYTGEGANENGELIDEAKKPTEVGLFVKGTESPSIREKAKRIEKKRLRGKVDDIDELERLGMQFAKSLIMGFQGLYDGTRPLEVTEDDLNLFFGQSEDLVDQVINFAKERRNFSKGKSGD